MRINSPLKIKEQTATLNQNVMNHLDYFSEWGGKSWSNLLSLAIKEIQPNNDLKGLNILDIGTRYGKIAVLFALMGANVTGVDISESSLEIAKEEANKWDVNVNFIKYDGNLDIFPDESFDLIFTKSVLVVVPDLDSFLKKISNKLKPGGRVIFLENSRGNFFFHLFRSLRHRHWNHHQANFFTHKQINLLRSIFHTDLVKQALMPPICLFIGKKKIKTNYLQNN